MKALYGAGSCFYLQINSRPPGSTGKNESDLWSEHLGAGHEDVDTVCVHVCMCVRGCVHAYMYV